jgi:Spy/CpxP family protein refolding chaperone
MLKLKIATLTVLGLLCAAPAMAQTSPDSQPAMGHHGGQMDRSAMHRRMCSEMSAHLAGHLAYLQAKLNLSPQQEAAWSKWRQIKLDYGAKKQKACLDMVPKAEAKPTVLDREAHAEQMLSAKLEELRSAKPALEALYAALTPEQKAIFDAAHDHHRHGHQMHGQMHGGGMN